ncbi:hypothetical protein D3C76_1480250 [compost metagenome]
MLLELDPDLAQVARADADVFQHLRVVVRELAATHGRANVVVRDPDLVADQSRPGEVRCNHISLIGRFGGCNQLRAGRIRQVLALLGEHGADHVGS